MSRVRFLLCLMGFAVAPAIALTGACGTGTPDCTPGLTLVNGNCVVVHDAGTDARHDAVADAPADAPKDGPDGMDASDGAVDSGTDGPYGVGPTFAGVTSVSPYASSTVAAGSSLFVTWDAAYDPTTTAAEMTYAVYLGKSSKGEDFTNPIKVTGTTSTVVGSLTKGQTYYVVVRAIDKAGFEDTNAIERSNEPVVDTTPPPPPLAVTALPLAGCNAKLSWTAVKGAHTDGPGMTYLVTDGDGLSAGTDAGGGGTPVRVGVTAFDSATNTVSVVVAGPDMVSPYHQYLVRSVDSLGNTSTIGTLGGTAASDVSFNATIAPFLANSCAPGCHTLNTTDKLSPIYDVGYAYQSILGMGAVAAKVCKPNGPPFCSLDAGDCTDWQDGGPVNLVVPNDPGCSVLYQVLNQNDMPPKNQVQGITACDTVLVHDWIANGASNN